MRVVFPDGSEFLNVPVKGLDLIPNLPVLGPDHCANAGASEFVDGEGLRNGTNVFVIGYPEATGDFPQPTIISPTGWPAFSMGRHHSHLLSSDQRHRRKRAERMGTLGSDLGYVIAVILRCGLPRSTSEPTPHHQPTSCRALRLAPCRRRSIPTR